MRLFFALAVGLSVVARTAQSAPPPASAFAPAAIEQAAISPDGLHVAFSSHLANRATISIATFDQPELATISLGDVDVEDLKWLGNEYVLAEVNYWHKFAGRALGMRRVVAITKEARIASTLMAKDKASDLLVRQSVAGIAHGPPPRAFLVGRAGLAPVQFRLPTLFGVNPADGIGNVVEEGTPRTINWGFDRDGQARTRLDFAPNGQRVILTRATATSEWAPFWTAKNSDEFRGYDAAADALMIARETPAGEQIMLKSLATGEVKPMAPPHATPPMTYIWDMSD